MSQDKDFMASGQEVTFSQAGDNFDRMEARLRAYNEVGLKPRHQALRLVIWHDEEINRILKWVAIRALAVIAALVMCIIYLLI